MPLAEAGERTGRGGDGKVEARRDGGEEHKGLVAHTPRIEELLALRKGWRAGTDTERADLGTPDDAQRHAVLPQLLG